MAWHLTGDAERFLHHAGDFLGARPVANTLIMTVTDRARRQAAQRSDPQAQAGPRAPADAQVPADPRAPAGPQAPAGPSLFGWWCPEEGPGAVAGTFLHTPPYPLVLGGGPDAAAAERAARDLAGELHAAGHGVTGVNGTEPEARAFADAWSARTGAAVRPGMHTRLYRLGTLVPPEPAPPGAARVAGGADADLVLGWAEEFTRGLGQPFHRGLSLDRLRDGNFMLWEAGGVPVSMAGATRAVAGVARVAPVWTPVPHRRRGFGSAVTAAITRTLLDAGAAEVVLFTDLANPVSNSIYQRLGYRPVHDRMVLLFTLR